MTDPTAWRVMAVEEEEGGLFKITAIRYRPDKYCYIERGDPLETQVLPDFSAPPLPPASISAQELQYESSGTVSTKIYLSWPSVTGVNIYKVKWRPVSGIWTEATAYGPSFDILNVSVGSYEIEVYSINPFGITSATAATLTFAVAGTGAPPADVTGLGIAPLTDTTATISWAAATDLDVTVGGQVLIRHDTRATPTASWETANPIAAVPGSSTSTTVQLLTGTYFVKFQDQTGNRSVAAASVYTTLPTPQPKLSVKTWAEESTVIPFSGTKTDLVYSSPLGGLFLDSSTSLNGQYIYKDIFDLGAVYSLGVRRNLISAPEILGGTPSSTDTVEAKTYFRTTNSDPLGSGGVTWSSWTEYANTISQCRGIELKVVCTASDPQVGMVISNLGAVAELQQRSEIGEAQGFSIYSITYANAFFQTPSVTINATGMQTGDYYTVSSPTRKGFTIEFRNSSDVLVVRDFTYTATGFGLQLSGDGDPPPTDPTFSKVSLLLPMDGGSGSTTFTDEGPSELMISVAGGVEINTASSRFGGASALFPVSVSPQYLSTPSSALFDFGALTPFTVEAFFSPSQSQINRGIFATRNDSNFSLFEIICEDTGLSWLIGNASLDAWADSSATVAGIISVDTWHHLAFVGDGVNLRLFVDGMQRLTTPQPSWGSANRQLFFGSGGTNNFTGRIDEVRVKKNEAVYTSNFTPPTAPFPRM